MRIVGFRNLGDETNGLAFSDPSRVAIVFAFADTASDLSRAILDDCTMTYDDHYLVNFDSSIEFYLLGRIKIEDCLALQRRLVFEAGERLDGRIDVLLCEHPQVITVGQAGSRLDVRLSGEELRRRQLEMKWTNRDGGCVLHAPGQLAIYPVVPLGVEVWSVAEYQRRLRSGIARALDSLRITHAATERTSAIWGRSGCLAVLGTALRNGIASQGAFVNVCPPMQNYGYVDSVREQSPFGGTKRTMGCVVAERRRPATMSEVRAALVESLPAAFDRRRYHIHTGHPFLQQEYRQVSA